MREEAVRIVPDSVKHGVLALAPLLPDVKAVAVVADRVDKRLKFQLFLRRSIPR